MHLIFTIGAGCENVSTTKTSCSQVFARERGRERVHQLLYTPGKQLIEYPISTKDSLQVMESTGVKLG